MDGQLSAAKLHGAHLIESEIGGRRQGLVQVFGDKKLLAVLVAEGLDARGRVEILRHNHENIHTLREKCFGLLVLPILIGVGNHMAAAQ